LTVLNDSLNLTPRTIISK